MAEWTTVISLAVLGFLLILIEVLFVPGTTIIGILGLISSIFGIYLSFSYFGTATGWWFVLGSSIFFAVSLYFSFKTKTWERFSLKSTIKSKVNEGLTNELHVNDEGTALSTIKPIGKGEFNEKEYEVKSLGSYIEPGTKIKIIKIDSNNIIIEPIQ